MTGFIGGLVLGGMLVFFIMEYRKWIAYLSQSGFTEEKNEESEQWQNLMTYDGSGRGQINREN